jgi:hypothetical protein
MRFAAEDVPVQPPEAGVYEVAVRLISMFTFPI